MLQLHLVVKHSFFVVDKLAGLPDIFMSLFYCSCNLEYFSMPWRQRWRSYDVIFAKNVWFQAK